MNHDEPLGFLGLTPCEYPFLDKCIMMCFTPVVWITWLFRRHPAQSTAPLGRTFKPSRRRSAAALAGWRELCLCRFWLHPLMSKKVGWRIIFFSGEFGDFVSDSCSLIFAAFRSYNYNFGFHVVFARFCSSYACWVGGGGWGMRELGVWRCWKF